MSACVLEFPSAVARVIDQVGGILFAEHIERFVESILLDKAVSSQVTTGGISSDEVLLGEEALGSSVVAGGEMDLREPECILVVFLYQISIRRQCEIMVAPYGSTPTACLQ